MKRPKVFEESEGFAAIVCFAVLFVSILIFKFLVLKSNTKWEPQLSLWSKLDSYKPVFSRVL